MFGNVYWLLMLRIDLFVSENYKIKSWKQVYFFKLYVEFRTWILKLSSSSDISNIPDHYREKKGDDNLKFRFETVGSTDGV